MRISRRRGAHPREPTRRPGTVDFASCVGAPTRPPGNRAASGQRDALARPRERMGTIARGHHGRSFDVRPCNIGSTHARAFVRDTADRSPTTPIAVPVGTLTLRAESATPAGQPRRVQAKEVSVRCFELPAIAQNGTRIRPIPIQQMTMALRAQFPVRPRRWGLARHVAAIPGSSSPYPVSPSRRKPRENRPYVLFDPAGTDRRRARRLQLADERPRTCGRE